MYYLEQFSGQPQRALSSSALTTEGLCLSRSWFHLYCFFSDVGKLLKASHSIAKLFYADIHEVV